MARTGEFEPLVLLAILRLGDDAYGVTVLDELERRTARTLTLGTVYKTLESASRANHFSWAVSLYVKGSRPGHRARGARCQRRSAITIWSTRPGPAPAPRASY